MKLLTTTLLLTLCAAQAQAAGEQIRLSLAEAVKSAVEHNLDVQAELYNPATAHADFLGNKGIYDTTLNFFTSYSQSTTEPASSFLAGSETDRQKMVELNPGITRLVPTGGTIGLVFNNTFNNNNSTIFPNNYWQSNLTLSLSQPLLKNFGRAATELNINVAKFNQEGTLEQFKTKLLDTIAQVRNEYFKLYSLREQLEVKKTSLLLAQKILTETKARVMAGVLPAMEIQNAEFGVASREKDLIDAERAVKDENDILHLLLQLPGGEEIVPLDVPSKAYFAAKVDEMIKRALELRPELKGQQIVVKTNELQARVSRSQTLPDLNLTASGALTGLDRRYNRDLEKIGSTNYPEWNVGLQFVYPLGNNTAENTYVRNKLKFEQAKVQARSLEQSIENEIKTAIRGIETSYKQIDVTDRGRLYAEERLQSYIKKNEVGLATTKDVLDVENDLVTAKGNQIQALVDYNDSITQLWRATGELLEREGVHVTSEASDVLYRRALQN